MLCPDFENTHVVLRIVATHVIGDKNFKLRHPIWIMC